MTMVLHQIIFNGLSLWEVFFVYAWLLLCFDRAFGAIFAVILTVLCFLAYHIGSYPWQGMIPLAISAFILGIFFRVTKNILLLWPFVWAVSASIGTMQAGLVFSLDDILMHAVILIVQIIFIVFCANRVIQRNHLSP